MEQQSRRHKSRASAGAGGVYSNSAIIAPNTTNGKKINNPGRKQKLKEGTREVIYGRQINRREEGDWSRARTQHLKDKKNSNLFRKVSMFLFFIEEFKEGAEIRSAAERGIQEEEGR
jgi:hypothetical protein